MSKKIIWGVVGIVVLVGVFLGGVSYGKNQTATSTNTTGSAFASARTRGAGGFGGGATVGQILSEDSTSITVGLASGGSKIIFLDNTTPITKQVNGNMSDLTVGTNVMVTGTANTDGSITAQSVRITPKLPATSTTSPSVVQ